MYRDYWTLLLLLTSETHESTAILMQLMWLTSLMQKSDQNQGSSNSNVAFEWNVFKTIGLIAIKFGKDIHAPQDE